MNEVDEFCERCDGFCECEAGDRLRANVIRADTVVNDQIKIIATLEAERDQLRDKLAECRRELKLTSATADKMADLLKRTAIALRGPEPSLKSWSWHDLPERAAAAIAAIDVMQRAAMSAARAHHEEAKP